MTRRHFFLLALIPLLMLTAWHFLNPGAQLKSAQARLLRAISQKDAAACGKLIHPDYTDQWNFTAGDWPGILKDLRTLSPILEVTMVNPVLDSGNGVVDTSLRVQSNGGHASGMISEKALELQEMTRFLWKREAWRPWSWQLVSVQNPALDIPSDYRPGNLTAMPAF